MSNQTAAVVLGVLLLAALPARAGIDETLLVCSWNTSNVLKYDGGDGGFLGALVGNGVGGLAQAHSLEVGPGGGLFVTSFGNDQVLEYDPHSGAFQGAFVTAGLGGLDGPTNATFGPDGRLYVTSFLSHSVPVYDGGDGSSLGNFVTPNSGGLLNPESLRFGPDGDLYVLSGVLASLKQYSGIDGSYIGDAINAGAGGLVDPHDFIFGPDGNFYVTAMDSGRVVVFDADGGFLEVLVVDDPGTPEDETGGLSSPHGLAFGPDGNLYVASFGSNQVIRYDPDTGDFIDVFVSAGNGLSGAIDLLFRQPLDPADLTGDGSVGTADLLLLLAAWGRCNDCGSCAADIDGDCVVATADLLILLGAWG